MLGAEIAIFDCEMTASQMRETEDILNIRVIDRTTLILDIFAMRAKSKEGKLQVELAQQKPSTTAKQAGTNASSETPNPHPSGMLTESPACGSALRAMQKPASRNTAR